MPADVAGSSGKKMVAQHQEVRQRRPRSSCRNIRRDGNKNFDDAEKAKTMTEDDRDKGKAKMQDLLKAYEGRIDSLSNSKEKEIMEQ